MPDATSWPTARLQGIVSSTERQMAQQDVCRRAARFTCRHIAKDRTAPVIVPAASNAQCLSDTCKDAASRREMHPESHLSYRVTTGRVLAVVKVVVQLHAAVRGHRQKKRAVFQAVHLPSLTAKGNHLPVSRTLWILGESVCKLCMQRLWKQGVPKEGEAPDVDWKVGRRECTVNCMEVTAPCSVCLQRGRILIARKRQCPFEPLWARHTVPNTEIVEAHWY